MGKRRIRIANLPPEVPEETLRAALAAYGEIITIHDEIWSKTHRYTVANGVKVFMMKLTKHLPSHMTIAGYRILTSYDGQPITCYGCGDTEHMFQVCPKRRGGRETSDPPTTTWAHVTANGPHNRRGTEERRKETAPHHVSTDQAGERQTEEAKPVSIPASPPNTKAQGDHKASRRQMPMPRDAKEPAPSVRPPMTHTKERSWKLKWRHRTKKQLR